MRLRKKNIRQQEQSIVVDKPIPVEESVYTSMFDIPFVLFEDCLVHNRLSSLIKTQWKNTPAGRETFKPEIPSGILIDAWLKLYSQYCELIGDNSLLSVVQLTAKIAILNSRITRVETTVAILREWHSPDHTSELNIDLMGVIIDISSAEKYQRSLDRVLSILKTTVIERDVLLEEYKAIQAKSKDGKPVTEAYFTGKLMEVSKYEGYPVKKGNITGAEYCEYIKRLNQYYQFLAEQQAKKTKHG